MALTRKRVLVTGGAGFLGSHLCERPLKHGDEVLCVDNYFTGRLDNITHLRCALHFEAMRHDITFPLFVGGTKFTIWPVQPRRCVTSTIRCKPPRPA